MRFCLDAIDAASKKLVDAVVTAPIAKESWKLAGYHYPGHTELFAQRTGARRYAMMFAGGPLKVVLATVHIPLNGPVGQAEHRRGVPADRADARGAGRLVRHPQARASPSAGVNPHASENGQFGDEEERIISPAILMARDQGIDATGPYPPDTIFLDGPRRQVRRRRRDVPRPGADPGEAAGVRPGGEPARSACRSSAPAPTTAPRSTSSAATAPTPARMRAAIEMAIDMAVKRHARDSVEAGAAEGAGQRRASAYGGVNSSPSARAGPHPLR